MVDSELAFTVGDLAQTRFAVSPMWEVVTSFRTLQGNAVYHRPWAEQVTPRIREAGLDRGLLAALIPAAGYLADFLNPTPATPFPDLAVELDAIRAADPRRVEVELGMLAAENPAPARLAQVRPEQLPQLVAAEIETYWELALAPYWARIRRLLEADVFHRARQVAEHGTAQVLNELHESLSWDENSLRLVQRHCKVDRGRAGAGLLLAPSAFAWPRVLTRIVPPDMPQLAYPARGVGTLWETRATAPADAVAAVLGRSRALLLAELDAPASTTELARRTELTAAGVSQHLTALRAAGLVSAHRAGRSVLYARTAVADALLVPNGG